MDVPFVELVRANPFVTSFCVDHDRIFLLAGNALLQCNQASGAITRERALFQKEGQARLLIADDTFLYIKDFCDLYILDKATLSTVHSLRLGADLRSDICGLGVDEHYLYASLRNGPMARLDKSRSFQPELFSLTDSSIWDFRLWNDLIYAGTVAGSLLVIDKARMTIVQKVQASKQNLKSICRAGDLLITAAQDKKMVARDARTLEVIAVVANAHQKAFSVVGVYEDQVYTVSPACGEIKAWDAKSWTLRRVIPCPGGHGSAFIADQRLYLASRSVPGLWYMSL